MGVMRSWPQPNIPALPTVGGANAPLNLEMFDSSAGGIVPLTPGDEAKVYVCGITPYDSTHLGHAATYVTFDLLNRQLIANGHTLRYVQNVTDVDDPLFERANRDGVDWRELGQQQTDLFRSDMEALGVIPPTAYMGVEESVEEIIELVQTLLNNGAAYVVDDPAFPDVYADIKATSQFGYESNYSREQMEKFFAARGGDPVRPGKRHPMDALLWRAARPGEPSWDSPFGPGRPGWHVECAAIAMKYLGIPFDVQGGGMDLVFPHHEFSAQHVEAACGIDRMASHYMHTGLIGLGGVKMSKSLGNLVFVSKLVAAGVDPSAIRLALYSGHYRQARNWSDELLCAATRRLAWWRQAVEETLSDTSTESLETAGRLIFEVRQALAKDLDSPKALELIDAWAATVPGLEDRRAEFSAVTAAAGVVEDGESAQGDAASVELAHRTAGTKFDATDTQVAGELAQATIPAAHSVPDSPAMVGEVVASGISSVMGVRI